ncbi:hypothetical protein V2J09_016416 [Rumex salicifolius]
MAPKVTVLKVSITCDKCKVKLLKAVAGIEGVNKIETDGEKSTLTVVGVADPHAIVSCARKVGPVEIVSIADPKKPEDIKKEEEAKKKKEEEEKKKKEEEEAKKKAGWHYQCPQPCYCRSCNLNYVAIPFDMPAAAPYGQYDQPGCILM